jgi:sugar phosphate permease
MPRDPDQPAAAAPATGHRAAGGIIASAPPPTRVRHIVLGLTIAAYMITYMDRVVISAAVPSIQKEFGFSIITMGWILSSFQWSYGLFQVPVAWLGDRLGPRRALTLIVTWWSLLTSATILSWSAASMAAIRFLFGMGEAGAFPIATRSLARWMRPSERGFAQGATHAGSRLGGALTPAIAAVIIARYGWRAAFLAFGCLGILWSAVWHWYYRDTPAEHPSVNQQERELIEGSLGSRNAASGERGSVPWKSILASRQMWLLSAMYVCYAYNISVYLAWFPKYLNDSRGVSLERMGLYASLPLLAGTAGDLLGGWLSDVWARRSGDLRGARRAMAIAGFLMAALSILPACYTSSPFASVLYSCLAMFGLELTVGVSWAIPLDIGGNYAGSVAAVMNTCGNLGGATASAATAYVVKLYGWNTAFLVVAALCVVAAILHLLIRADHPIPLPR